MSLQDLSARLAVDAKGLADLRREVRGNSAAANREVARQFEALFMQTVLKAMRDATPQDGIFDSEQTRFFQSMHDQQLVQNLAARGGGIGLAALIEKQLSRNLAPPMDAGLPVAKAAETTSFPSPAATSAALSAPVALSALPGRIGAAEEVSQPAPGRHTKATGLAQDFVDRVWPHAFEASRQTGIPAHFIIAQAALETGWGKSEPRLPDGSRSHNLFGIKAGRDWEGPTVEAVTREVEGGIEQRQRASFRVYASEAEAFQDYARLMTVRPRYAAVPGTQDAASFARKLQQAGYATDPLYADKLVRIIDGSLLRRRLQQV